MKNEYQKALETAKQDIQEIANILKALDQKVFEIKNKHNGLFKSKSGMYGETPKIIIGGYDISEMSDKETCDSVWINDLESGEGAEIRKSEIEPMIKKIFNKNF